jgi:hypothetical protein
VISPFSFASVIPFGSLRTMAFEPRVLAIASHVRRRKFGVLLT